MTCAYKFNDRCGANSHDGCSLGEIDQTLCPQYEDRDGSEPSDYERARAATLATIREKVEGMREVFGFPVTAVIDYVLTLLDED